jgi:hypothetical protein
MYAPPTTARRCELHSEPTVWPPDAPAPDAAGELGELAGRLTGLCVGLWVWMAFAGGPPPDRLATIPAIPPTTITASAAATTRTVLLRGTVLISEKLPRRYIFSQGTSHCRLSRKTNSLLIC